MIGYAVYLNQNVTIIRVIDSGSAIGSCLVKYTNGSLSWINYKDLTILSWQLVG